MGETVQCTLCPRMCLIADGESGDCRSRVNIDGTLTALTYGFPCSVNIDPVEKKPLFHFLPSTQILSLAAAGCNLHCLNCQNWEISQAAPEDTNAHSLPPEQVPLLCKEYGCPSIAYTYTDPVIYYEYTLDSCIKAKDMGIRNVLVTAGYINKDPLQKLCRYVDAANIDLKAFSDRFYRDVCRATLQPVLDALLISKESGVSVEVTNLLIPTLNDSDRMIKDLCRWISGNMGLDTPLHFSRFFPRHKLTRLPPTPESSLLRAREIAWAEGLHFVYVGNVLTDGGGSTYCPSCKELLLDRIGYNVRTNALKNGACPKCNTVISGIWR